MTLVRVRRPSFARYRALVRSAYAGLSTLRSLQYEGLETLGLSGRVLDLGGGDRSNYYSRIDSWRDLSKPFTYHSANIDPKIQPTYLIQVGQKLPVEDESYDTVLSLNTLEHIYDVSSVLSEVRRVLKPGGLLVVMVPFMFRVHGHPDDYTRGTPSFWTKCLDGFGFDPSIEALVWGPFTAGQGVSGLPGPFKLVRRHGALLLDLVYALLRRRGGDVVTAVQDDPVCAAPVGYFIRAVKR